MRFIALDIESTGVDPRTDRIIELHMATVRWPTLQTLGERTLLFNPGIPIPPEATLVNGFDDEMVEDCGPFVDCAPDLQDTFDDSVIIAYNGRRFDVPLLHNELRRAGMPGLPVDQRVIDPYEIFLQDLPRTLSGAVQFYVHREHTGAHSAKADVDAMIQVLGVQMLYRPAPDILAAACDPERLPLDRSGCFYRDPGGVIRFGFGKHKGKPAAAYPEYLKWMLRRDFDEDAKKCAKDCLEHIPAAA